MGLVGWLLCVCVVVVVQEGEGEGTQKKTQRKGGWQAQHTATEKRNLTRQERRAPNLLGWVVDLLVYVVVMCVLVGAWVEQETRAEVHTSET